MCAVLCCGVRLGADELRLGEITQRWVDRQKAGSGQESRGESKLQKGISVARRQQTCTEYLRLANLGENMENML